MRLISILCSIMLLTACKDAPVSLTATEQQQLTPLLQQMRPVCLGRFLIDLPAGSQLVASDLRVTQMYSGKAYDRETLIESLPMSPGQFHLLVQRRREELTRLILPQSKQPMLFNELPVPDGEGVIFDHTQTSVSEPAERSYELWAYKQGYTIRMLINHWAYIPGDKEDISTSKDMMKELLSTFARVRGRAETEIPTEPGVCFGYGFLAGAPMSHEAPNSSYSMPGMEDVVIGISSDNRWTGGTDYDDIGIDSVSDKAIAETAGGTYRVVRLAKREGVDGLKFKEVLRSEPSRERYADAKGNLYPVQGHFFTLENYDREQQHVPYLQLSLLNGQRLLPQEVQEGTTVALLDWNKRIPTIDSPAPELHKASLSEAQAVVLWDKIASTFRRRPNGY